jgi:O-antigen ligase
MEILLVKLLYFAKPLLNAELFAWSLFGFGFFELAAMLLFLLLVGAFGLNFMQKARDPVSAVEVWAILFIVWSTISYLVHIEISVAASFIKITMPIMVYLMLKKIIPDRATYVRMVFLMLIGFLVPFLISAVTTHQGQGLEMTLYWTGVERYRGVYGDIHSMAHNAGFAIMLTGTYLALRNSQKAPLNWAEVTVLALVFLVGVYLLFHTHARTLYVGLGVFLFVTLFFYSKKALALSVIFIIALVAYFSEAVGIIFFDFVDPQYTGEHFERAGSGRLTVWTESLDAWRNAPFLNQLTGMGLGNTDTVRAHGTIEDAVRPYGDPHNDWLFALMSLGLLGVGILVGLLASILRAILRIDGKEKFAFLGLFAAVIVMNLLSNSYISRVTMAQLFFMVMVYVDLREGPIARRTAVNATLRRATGSGNSISRLGK